MRFNGVVKSWNEGRGFGFIEMEGHEARAAIAALNGTVLNGRPMKVNEERPRDKRPGGRR